jgi:cysteinyl-tRNA synthetase
MKTSVRINNDEYDKENAADFALWKAYKPED